MLTLEQVEQSKPKAKFTLRQCSEVFDVSYRTILRWIDEKRLTVKEYSRRKKHVTREAILECENRATKPAIP